MKALVSKPDIAEIIRDNINDYIWKYGITNKQKKVVNHILECRTEQMGGHRYVCDTCGDSVIHYNSCRDRHCPRCQGTARALWVSKRIDELLPVGHFHVVFTIPNELNPFGFGLRNKKAFFNVLFKSASETLIELARDKRWLGADIGVTALLHTWGQNMLDHPHVHCIVPGGGIRLDGKKWVNFRNNYLFPTDVLSSLFRGKFLDYFSKAITAGEIQLIGELEQYTVESGFKQFKKKLWNKDWVVYVKEPFAEPAHIVKYLGRYTHRIAISNKRIVEYKDQNVSFKWKDYSDDSKIKTMEVSGVEFLRRFFLHILPDYYTRIRYFGILSNSQKSKKLEESFRLLARKYEKKKRPLAIVAILREMLGIDITKCPECSKGYYNLVEEIHHYKRLLFIT